MPVVMRMLEQVTSIVDVQIEFLLEAFPRLWPELPLPLACLRVFIASLAAFEQFKDEDISHRPLVMAGHGGLGCGQVFETAMLAGDMGCCLEVFGLQEKELRQKMQEAVVIEGPTAVGQIVTFFHNLGFSVWGTEKSMQCLKGICDSDPKTLDTRFCPQPHFNVAYPYFQAHQANYLALLSEITPNMKAPIHTVWVDSFAKPIDPGSHPGEIAEQLREILVSPSLYHQMLRGMIREGVGEFVSMYPSGLQSTLRHAAPRYQHRVSYVNALQS